MHARATPRMKRERKNNKRTRARDYLGLHPKYIYITLVVNPVASIRSLSALDSFVPGRDAPPVGLIGLTIGDDRHRSSSSSIGPSTRHTSSTLSLARETRRTKDRTKRTRRATHVSTRFHRTNDVDHHGGRGRSISAVIAQSHEPSWPTPVKMQDRLKGKKTLVVGLPGAFTPT